MEKRQCWMCKKWEQTYEVRERGEIVIVRGKCPTKKGHIVNDTDPICWEFRPIEGENNGRSTNNTSQ